MSGKKVIFRTILLVIIAASNAWCSDNSKGIPPTLCYPDIPYAYNGTDNDSLLWLNYVDGLPEYFFFLPDIWNDHYLNVRFSTTDPCTLRQAAFCFFKNHPDNDSTAVPDIQVLVWENDELNSLYPVNPDSALSSVLVDGSVIAPFINRPDSAYAYPIPLSALLPLDTVFVDLSSLNLFFDQYVSFHVGWDPELTNPVDSLHGALPASIAPRRCAALSSSAPARAASAAP